MTTSFVFGQTATSFLVVSERASIDSSRLTRAVWTEGMSGERSVDELVCVGHSARPLGAGCEGRAAVGGSAIYSDEVASACQGVEGGRARRRPSSRDETSTSQHSQQYIVRISLTLSSSPVESQELSSSQALLSVTAPRSATLSSSSQLFSSRRTPRQGATWTRSKRFWPIRPSTTCLPSSKALAMASSVRLSRLSQTPAL